MHALAGATESDVKPLSFDLAIFLDVHAVQVLDKHTPELIVGLCGYHRVVDDVPFFALASVKSHNFKVHYIEEIILLRQSTDLFHEKFLLIGMGSNNSYAIFITFCFESL